MRALVACLCFATAFLGGTAFGDGFDADTRGDGLCPPSRYVSPTPRDLVPAEVSAWADGRAVLGIDSIWALKKALRWRPVSDGAGGYSLKFPWYVVPAGEVPSIEVSRLGRGGRRVETLTAVPNVAYGSGGTFVTSTLPFSRPGCWEVMARHGDAAVRFEIRVPRGAA